MTELYIELQTIISNFLFNGNPSTTMYGNLIVETIPAIICTVLIFVPFIIAWRIIKRLI